MLLNDLENRLLEISYKYKLSHLGSCLTTLPILLEIYENKQEDDRVVLSSGHAGLALYVILEHFYKFDAEQLLNDFGIHPVKDITKKIFVSTGSLGSGILIAIGLAIAVPGKNVHCIISDGECAEGSVWEALRYSYDNNIRNLKIYINANGYGAYSLIDTIKLKQRLMSFNPTVKFYRTNLDRFKFLNGLDSHYHIMTEIEYGSTK